MLIKAPAVSGALTYQGVCVATKYEERRQKDLSKRHQYRRDDNILPSSGSDTFKNVRGRSQTDRRTRLTPSDPHSRKRCYVCNSTEHLMKDCRARPTESSGSNIGNNLQTQDKVKVGKLRVLECPWYQLNQKVRPQ